MKMTHSIEFLENTSSSSQNEEMRTVRKDVVESKRDVTDLKKFIEYIKTV